MLQPRNKEIALNGIADDSWAFCESILPDVSRSFALIIPMCPAPIDRALCVGYLLCRIADTVEDEPALDDGQRQRLYDGWLAAVAAPLDEMRIREFLESWPTIPANEYGRLIRGTHDVLRAYASLPDAVRAPIQTCVQDMVAGMRSTTPADIREGITFLCGDLPELERYCHYVAGTVGIMSTALFEQRLVPRGFEPSALWREQGRRLGLGLQMTNILKDCNVDAERGVSFIPARYYDFTTQPLRLSAGGRMALIRYTLEHLDAAMQYVLAVPTNETGIRTFLLGSLFPAVATLAVVAESRQFHPKIERAAMTDIITTIQQHADDNTTLETWFQQHR